MLPLSCFLDPFKYSRVGIGPTLDQSYVGCLSVAGGWVFTMWVELSRAWLCIDMHATNIDAVEATCLNGERWVLRKNFVNAMPQNSIDQN